MASYSSFLCVSRLPVTDLLRLPFKIMPARRTRVTSERPGPSETLAVRRAIVCCNFVHRTRNAATTFVPAWLLRVSGAVCRVHLIHSLVL
jgi:hypothetical protein